MRESGESETAYMKSVQRWRRGMTQYTQPLLEYSVLSTRLDTKSVQYWRYEKPQYWSFKIPSTEPVPETPDSIPDPLVYHRSPSGAQTTPKLESNSFYLQA